MSRIERTLNVRESGICKTIVFETVTTRTVWDYVELGTGRHEVQRSFFNRNKRTQDQDYYDAIGQWMKEH